MKRGVCALLMMAMLAGGCANTSGRAIARNVLIALAVGSAGIAVGAAVKGHGIEQDLKTQVAAGGLAGRTYVMRDDEGNRWNRVGRAAAFTSGLFVASLAVLWEMSESAAVQNGPAEKTPAEDPHPIIPLPGQAPSR
jgi:hypothetical protein